MTDITAIIDLQVSKGPKMVKFPDLKGKTYEEAYQTLLDLGFTLVTREDVESNQPAGEVVGQSVEVDAEVPVTTEIVVQVSLGPPEPEIVRKSAVVDLQDLFLDAEGNPMAEPAEPFYFELRDEEGQMVMFIAECTQISFTVELEGYGLRTFEMYVDDIFAGYLTVDFRVTE